MTKATDTGSAATTKPATTKPATTKPAATKPAATKPVTTKPVTTKPAATKPVTTKPAATKPATSKPAAKQSRSAAETEKIRVALTERRDELQQEYDASLIEITDLQRERLADSAGDDDADTGTKTFEREQEITLANNLLERITQVERAIDRLGEGHYGYCERCGSAIPVERLAAFPSATLCVSCKQLEERR
jgi:DnaK suppressor protein